MGGERRLGEVNDPQREEEGGEAVAVAKGGKRVGDGDGGDKGRRKRSCGVRKNVEGEDWFNRSR